jgi:hypothetical protein
MINSQEFFTHALHDSEAVTALLAYTEDAEGNHLPNIFEYPCEEELGDNPGKPYIVVQNTGTTKAEGCKDFGFDEENDITTIEVTVVTSSKEDAKAVAQTTRDAIREAMNDFSDSDADFFGFCLEDSTYSDRGVQFDVESGNYFVTLTYRIETTK